MDDDRKDYGGWLLVLVVVAVLVAGGVVASRSDAATTSPGGTAAGTPVAVRSTPATAVGGPARTMRPTGLDAPPCTRVDTHRSGDGRSRLEYAVSDAGSTRCLLQTGDRGDEVTALQRALALCAGQSVPETGTFDAVTASALRATQLALGGAGDAVYGPNTSRVLGWPWFDAGSGRFTGRCSPAGAGA